MGMKQILVMMAAVVLVAWGTGCAGLKGTPSSYDLPGNNKYKYVCAHCRTYSTDSLHALQFHAKHCNRRGTFFDRAK